MSEGRSIYLARPTVVPSMSRRCDCERAGCHHLAGACDVKDTRRVMLYGLVCFMCIDCLAFTVEELAHELGDRIHQEAGEKVAAELRALRLAPPRMMPSAPWAAMTPGSLGGTD